MKILKSGILFCLIVMVSACNKNKLEVEIVETSAAGNKLASISSSTIAEATTQLTLLPKQTYQTITGFGGSFTEASAYLLNNLSEAKRDEIIEAYFGNSGAKYSLTRTHINSSDFSLSNYSFAPVENDTLLKHFSIEEDKNDILPFIKDAMAISSEGFKIIASPWTASPWMKDNNHWVGGKLLPKYYKTWALFFDKYIEAYKQEGINIWGITVENEPLGNGNNWESMHFTPSEMTYFVQHFLGPQLEQNNADVKILGFDQNRDELKHWVDDMFKNETSAKYFDGTAIHWYASTYDFFPEELQYAHNKAPNKYLIQTEACVDAEVPKWKDDAWYWSKEATDWGWDWAPDNQKHLHPKYVPVYRYARDIIGCLNNWVDGWIDWNMVLNKQGGPNWFKNWCVAPVIVDIETDEVYYTPLYYTLAHFSKYMRPQAKRIGFEINTKAIQTTAVQNPDGSIAVIIFNENNEPHNIQLNLNDKSTTITISAKAIQTVVIANK